MKVSKPFRLKDEKTGLYYCPNREIKVNDKYVKSNLSRKGKIYFESYDGNVRLIYDHTEIIMGKPIIREAKLNIEYLEVVDKNREESKV